MIQASFGRTTRAASIAGAYQYDTGQRLAMHGLPGPEELSAQDDFLSGDLAAVEAHFSRAGDSQSEMRLAIWDAERGVWTAAVPDEYLSVSEEVRLHVYVSHGSHGEATRGRTAYEGVFTPIARPAPFGVTTPEQEAEWQEKVIEIDLALAACETAAESAQFAAAQTDKAAQKAAQPADQAQAAASRAQEEEAALITQGWLWETAAMEVTALSPGAKATVSLTQEGGVPRFCFGIPRGADGAPGAQGAAGPADVEFIMDGTTLVINTTSVLNSMEETAAETAE